MSEPQRITTVSGLIDKIKLANNGYLVLDYMRADDAAFAREVAQSGQVVITNGTVHLPKTKPEFFKSSYPTAAFKLRTDGPDYEGAILARQEAEGVFD